jgi:uncharacterized protein YmfQ (DUF2313 family)
MSDRLVFRDALLALLPTGPALPRDPASPFVRVIEAMAAEFAHVSGRARVLLDEADPREADELFGEWEALVGLPDDCQPIERFSRFSAAWWFDGDGRLRAALPNELRRLPNGRPGDTPLVEPARVNLVRNPRAEGALAGSPGTPPTHWATLGSGGIAVQIAAAGVTDATPFIDVRMSGTVASAGSAFVWFETANSIAALSGQAFAHSYHVQLVSQAAGGLLDHRAWIAEVSAALSVVRQEFVVLPLPGPGELAAQRAVQLVTTSGGASTAWIRPFANFNFAAGTHDVTVRLALPQLERGDGATSPILPQPGLPASSSRAADQLSIASLAERRARVVSRLTDRPGQSRAFFIGLAASLGVTATITEFSETSCEAPCEEPVHGPEWRHAWRMNLPPLAGGAEFTCQDTCETPLAQWAPSDIECRVRRFAPAQTVLLFGYG